MRVEDYDLIVISSGPSGEKGAAQAAYFGKKVAMTEKEGFPGGAAANTGTRPSKSLREKALHHSGFRKREIDGWDFDLNKRINAKNFPYHFHSVRTRERERIGRNMSRLNVDVFHGAGSFTDAHTVRLHSASGYITPHDKLLGKDKAIFAAREQKLPSARLQRKINHPNQPAHSVTHTSIVSN